MRLWPFGRTETRASIGDATDVALAHLQTIAAGEPGTARALAVVETCAGLWERAFASATVKPDAPALRSVSSHLLAVMGRALAYRGEFVGVIEIAEGIAMLTPATTWDITGAASPSGWLYRLDLTGPTSTRTMTLPSDAVLHVRIGASAETPWQGRSPLARSPLTAGLAARVEKALDKDQRVPVGRIFPIETPSPGQRESIERSIVKGGMTIVDQMSPRGEQQPSERWNPVAYGPSPDQVSVTLRDHLVNDVLSAFGIPPVLYATTGDGSGQREAWRRFWAGTMQLIARLLQAELRAKLDPRAEVMLDALRASDEDGRSRAVSRRVQAASMAVEKLGMQRGEALRLAGLDD